MKNSGISLNLENIQLSLFLNKDILSAFAVSIVFQIVNLDYLLSWNRVKMAELTDNDVYDFVANDLEVYTKFNTMGLIVSLLLFYSVSLKVIFMIFSDIKLRKDKWTMMDTILSFQGIISYSIISTLTVEDILYQSDKKLY